MNGLKKIIWNLIFQNLKLYDTVMMMISRRTLSIKQNAMTKQKIVEHAKDLGIIMSSSGNFKQHIRTMVGAAQQLCDWILRTFSTRKKDTMLLL